MLAAAFFICTVAWISDGDTLTCREREPSGAEIRVRLSGINARERDGTCGRGHPCPAASAEASMAALERAAAEQVLRCRQVGVTYHRRAAFCRRGDGLDLSCVMMVSGTVARWASFWGRHRCR